MDAAVAVLREQQAARMEERDPDSVVVEYDFPPFLRQYKSGRVERYGVVDAVPAGTDDDTGTGVASRDVVINPSTGLWARLYLPAAAVSSSSSSRLPVVVFYHGGAFVVGSTAWRSTHVFLNRLAADAHVLIVSPEYRLAPEHPLPAAFDDSWEALGWVASHEDPWLSEQGDLSRAFLAGASAGATIAHNMAARAGLPGCSVQPLLPFMGLILVHPFFAGEQPIGEEPADRVKAGAFWRYRCPGTTGLDDPLCNPFAADGCAARLAARCERVLAARCERVLVCVADKDALRDRGVWYRDGIVAGFSGERVALHESLGVGHVFHYSDPDCDQARQLHARILQFMSSCLF